MKLIDAKCPNCNALLKLEDKKDRVICEYCNHTIFVEEAIATYKFKITGNISVDGIQTNSDLIASANELLDMGEYLKAKKKFLEFSEKCPQEYQGWLGLLICRTRNFTIRDDNALFENDIRKYYEHFLRTASEKVKKDYLNIIEEYMFPNDINRNNSEIISENQNNNLNRRKFNQDACKHIIPTLSLIFAFLCISAKMIFPAILWFLMFLLFLPLFNQFLSEKIFFIEKYNKLIKFMLSIITIVLSVASIKSDFDGMWLNNDKSYVEFSNGKCFIGTYENSKMFITYIPKYTSSIDYTYDDNVYIIYCGTDYKFKYSKNNLCIFENDICSKDYVRK